MPIHPSFSGGESPFIGAGGGESPFIGSGGGRRPAVHNAVIDALSPYGIRHIDLPVNGAGVAGAAGRPRVARPGE
jgi:hypothetical protein